MGEIRHIQVIDVCFDDVDSTVLASFPKRTRKKEPQKPFVAFGREVAETPFGRVGLLSNMAMALQQAPRRPCRVDGHGLQSPNTEPARRVPIRTLILPGVVAPGATTTEILASV